MPFERHNQGNWQVRGKTNVVRDYRKRRNELRDLH